MEEMKKELLSEIKPFKEKGYEFLNKNNIKDGF